MTTGRIPENSELDKMLDVRTKSQAIGEFIEWLQEQGWAICKADKHDRYFPICISIENFLAEYFEIDLKKVEEERRAIFEVTAIMSLVHIPHAKEIVDLLSS